MLYGDFVTDTLNARYERCLHPLRQRRTLERWQVYPALAGRTLPEITAIVTDGYHTDHNHVAAAIVDAHQQCGDRNDDAMTILLIAARPLVLSLDPCDVDGDSRATLWNAVGWRLHAMTVAEIAGNPTPFLVMLHGRIRYLRAGSPARRHAATRLVRDPDHLQHGHVDDVADQVIERHQLDEICRQPAWPDLARWLRVGEAASGIHHQWATRTRRRLAKTVDYAA